MEYTFDQVADLLDEMAETFPPVFFEQLNGGILLQEEAKPDPMFPEGEVYFMGEYVQDSYLGRYINLYYGSFLASARNEAGQRNLAGRALHHAGPRVYPPRGIPGQRPRFG